MAKTSHNKKTSGGGPSVNELLRNIERLDRDLVKLANERAKLTERLGKATKDAGHSPYDSVREKQQIEQAVATSKGPLSANALAAVLRELTSAARALTKNTKVAYLGPQFSYSHQAAVEHFGAAVDYAPVNTIAAVFEELNRGHAEYGIVPLENSTDGRIADTLEMFAKHPIRICGEVQLRIHHNLLAKCPRDQVTEVYSKPQALSQCRDWLAKHLPGVRLVEMTSTAAAAHLAADKPGAAAVASLQAGIHCGLDVLAASIEDNRHNLTRFAVIGGEAPKRTGKDKTAMMFELAHSPGSLADAMLVFKKGRLNLTWIESFPFPSQPNEYLFFVEFEGHQTDAAARRGIEALRRRVVRLEVLGSYPRGTPID
ncbi:MAG TPA: prephenate dehydratase [Pirellulaceae bacterium]|nr:prephenate dehydratase [Pirellulaceae bacterium]